jgi:predicted protein tyrosine phosphatase
MWFEEIGRHLTVTSQKEAYELIKADKNFWHVISIHAPNIPRPHFPGAKGVYHVAFDDIENHPVAGEGRCATARDLQDIFHFVDEKPGQPLLVHCQMGISRSAAVAAVLIMRELRFDFIEEKGLIERTAELLVAIRPIACPNVLVLRLGLEQFLPLTDAERLTTALVNHPELFANRFKHRPSIGD